MPGVTRWRVAWRGGVEGEVLGEEGAGADEGEVAAEDAPELGELVEAGGPELGAEGGEAVGVRERAAVLAGAIKRKGTGHPNLRGTPRAILTADSRIDGLLTMAAVTTMSLPH
jgi:hypothetical protein